MRACDIKQSNVYKLKPPKNYGYIKVLCVLNPKQSLFCKDFYGNFCKQENKNNFIIVRCLHSSDRNFNFGILRDFRPRDIIVEK